MNRNCTRLMAVASMAAAMLIVASGVSWAEPGLDETLSGLPVAPTPPASFADPTTPSSSMLAVAPVSPSTSAIPTTATAQAAPIMPLTPAAPATSGSAAATPNVMEGCCGGHCDAEEYCCRHVIATAEAVWLAPCDNQRAGSFGIFNGATSVEQFSAASATNEGLIATPRIMLGIQGECCGAQIRYWRMEETRDVNASNFLDGTGAISQGGFFAETLDLEVTRMLCIGESTAQASFGVRYAQLNQRVGIYANDVVNGDLYSGSALSDLNFSGIGLTSSLWGLKPINCSNFNLFYSVRASILWDGNPSNFVQTTANYESGVNGFATTYNAARAGDSSNMFIGELQLGGQWNFALKCVPANAFLRCAFEYQYWAVNDTGFAASTSAAGAVGGPLVGVATGRSGDAFVNLVGFNVGTGITW